MIISGTELSNKIRNELKEKIEFLKNNNKRIPKLVVIIVGENPASISYVKNKEKAAKEIGFLAETIKLNENTEEKDLLKVIDELNSDKTVDGILVQLPLPKHLSEHKVIEAIIESKDVDGFTTKNTANLTLGLAATVSCTPKGIMSIIESVSYDLEGKNAVVIGRSNIVGKPVSSLLLNKNATVTICHSKTKNLKEITKNADILIVAIGIANFVDETFIKEGCFVVDVGISRVDGKIVGDCNFDSLKDKVSYITPVPGGVGPMTITSLFENTLELYYTHE